MELAKAVTFVLLGPPTDQAPLLQSMPVDTRMVELKLGELKNQREVCQIVSAFRHMQAKVARDDKVDAKLRELEILLPEDQIQSHRDLMRQVQEFAFRLRRS